MIGDGDMDIVFVMGWVSHLEYFWKHPPFASFLSRLASFSRLILFDKRGTGLSDRVPVSELPTLEQRMEDVHAVMDAVGSERAVLIGVSEGGPMCSLFAATYPERTVGLVMIGTYAKRIRDEDYPWASDAEQRDAFFEMMQTDWGKPVGIEERAPSMADDADFREWWATYLADGCKPRSRRRPDENERRDRCPQRAAVDPRADAGHSPQRRYVPEGRRGPLCRFEHSRQQLRRADGIDHLPFVGDQEEILQPIEDFLKEMHCDEEYDRVLATVLSVKLIERPGADAMTRAEAHIRRQLELFKGREVLFTETDVLATFDGPARAIRCAAAITSAAERMDITLKTGLHTGECDVVDQIYSGYAVDLAQKIADASDIGRTLVSRTVKDLVAGSGILFEEFGHRSFDGIEGNWRLFTVAGQS